MTLSSEDVQAVLVEVATRVQREPGRIFDLDPYRDRILLAAADDDDDRQLRREALDAAVRAQRGPETGAEIAIRAAELLAFLRGEAPSRQGQEDAAYRAAEQ